MVRDALSMLDGYPSQSVFTRFFSSTTGRLFLGSQLSPEGSGGSLLASVLFSLLSTIRYPGVRWVLSRCIFESRYWDLFITRGVPMVDQHPSWVSSVCPRACPCAGALYSKSFRSSARL